MTDYNNGSPSSSDDLSAHQEQVVQTCSFHTTVNAEETCSRCKTPICKTCTFGFPDGLVLCPTCATEKPEVMTAKRKKGRLVSFTMASIATFFFLLLFGGLASPLFGNMSEEDIEILAGLLFIFLILIPSIIGLSFGIGSLNKRRGNPASVLVPTIWNGILLGIWILFTIIGTLAE